MSALPAINEQSGRSQSLTIRFRPASVAGQTVQLSAMILAAPATASIPWEYFAAIGHCKSEAHPEGKRNLFRKPLARSRPGAQSFQHSEQR